MNQLKEQSNELERQLLNIDEKLQSQLKLKKELETPSVNAIKTMVVQGIASSAIISMLWQIMSPILGTSSAIGGYLLSPFTNFFWWFITRITDYQQILEIFKKFMLTGMSIGSLSTSLLAYGIPIGGTIFTVFYLYSLYNTSGVTDKETKFEQIKELVGQAPKSEEEASLSKLDLPNSPPQSVIQEINSTKKTLENEKTVQEPMYIPSPVPIQNPVPIVPIIPISPVVSIKRKYKKKSTRVSKRKSSRKSTKKH